jgi:putative PIN family toxin of toxin-antitoxin system
MKRVVIDTNVIVSAALSITGKPAQILELISTNEILLVYSEEMLAEYRRVLAYTKLNISRQTQAKLIQGIEGIGILIEPTASEIPMIDESDRVFYDTAKEAGATLITGNTKHYPEENFIMTPAHFLESM